MKVWHIMGTIFMKMCRFQSVRKTLRIFSQSWIMDTTVISLQRISEC